MISRNWVVAVGSLSACAGFGIITWKLLHPSMPQKPNPQVVQQAPMKKPVLEGFDQVLAVFASGGSSQELEQAIAFLDTNTRLARKFSANQHASLLAAMEHGTPAGMTEGPWSHIFNSACNALAVGQSTPDEEFIKMLENIAVNDPRLVMRLYALQHLGERYASATPVCQQRLRDLVQGILKEEDASTAGTALVLWQRWESLGNAGGVSALEVSRAMVMDAKRPVDVRVSALHAVGDDPEVLAIARTIATDLTQPVILRKAALSLIGRHGQSVDLALLSRCGSESQRMSQACLPAADAIKSRLNNDTQPVLIPVQ